MSFGGSVASMITTLKNNKRPRGSVLKKLKSYQNANYKKGRIEKKATLQQLKEIRERLQKENKRNRRVTIILVISFGIILSILFIIFNFIKF